MNIETFLMSYINKNNVIHVCNNTSCITVSLSFFIPQTNRITMHKHQLKLSISSWKACMQYLIKAQNVFHSFNTRDFLMKNPVDTFFFFTNLERLQRQKAKVGEEESCCLKLLRGWRGFAVSLWVRETLGLPDFLAVPLQGVLILYLLGHQNTKLVVLNFQL